MILASLQLEAGHVLTIALFALGYLVAGLIAWGTLRTEVKNQRDLLEKVEGNQQHLVTADNLRAAVAELKLELYRAVGADKRDESAGRRHRHDDP